MKFRTGMASSLLAALLVPGFAAAADEPQSCPVTNPTALKADVPFEPDQSSGRVWYGSDALAVLLPADGRWMGLGPGLRYGDKLWMWRRGYDAKAEPKPNLVIDAHPFGMSAPHVRIENATSAYRENWNRMLVSLEFPMAGCWEVTAIYEGRALKFVLEVGQAVALTPDSALERTPNASTVLAYATAAPAFGAA